MPDLEGLKNLADTFEAVVSGLAILAAGAWAYRRYVTQAESHPHIQTACQIRFIGTHADCWLVELVATLENKGKVEHRFKNFVFELNGLRNSDPAQGDQRWGGQIDFPFEIVKGSFLPTDYQYFSLGPGVQGNYSYVGAIPKDVSSAILHCKFQYMDRVNYSHSMESITMVPGK